MINMDLDYTRKENKLILANDLCKKYGIDQKPDIKATLFKFKHNGKSCHSVLDKVEFFELTQPCYAFYIGFVEHILINVEGRIDPNTIFTHIVFTGELSQLHKLVNQNDFILIENDSRESIKIHAADYDCPDDRYSFCLNTGPSYIEDQNIISHFSEIIKNPDHNANVIKAVRDIVGLASDIDEIDRICNFVNEVKKHYKTKTYNDQYLKYHGKESLDKFNIFGQDFKDSLSREYEIQALYVNFSFDQYCIENYGMDIALYKTPFIIECVEKDTQEKVKIMPIRYLGSDYEEREKVFSRYTERYVLKGSKLSPIKTHMVYNILENMEIGLNEKFFRLAESLDRETKE